MVVLRDATAEDAIEVAGVHVRTWQAAYRGIFPDEFLDSLSTTEWAARYTLGSHDPQAPQTILAVDARDALLGFAMFGRCRDEDASDAAELQALYVDPPHWRRGVGRQLLDEACSLMRGDGFGRAVLWVLDGNDVAAAFYRAEGWTADGASREENLWGAAANVSRYRRALPVQAGGRAG